MPFIWNDTEWSFIDKKEKYNSEEFVIVRKLGIDIQHTENIQLSEETIRKAFNKYGPIESVEWISTKIGVRTRSKKKPEAYITFVHDKDAYFAMIDNSSSSSSSSSNRPDGKFIVAPAAKCHQPKPAPGFMHTPNDENDPMELTISLQNLNNYCLIKIFEHCDVESLVHLTAVCRLFNKIIHTHLFPKVKQFEIVGYRKPTMTGTMLCKILRCIGPHVIDLTFHYLNNNITKKILMQMLARYVGKNVRQLNISGIKLTNKSIQVIKEVLKRLHILLYEYYDCVDERCEKIDLQTYCPNLYFLYFSSNTATLVQHNKPWTSLESLSIDDYRTLSFESFAMHNPQLKCLQYKQNDDDFPKLDVVLEYLPNLEKLSIRKKQLFDVIDLLLLKRLKHLTNLILKDIKIGNENELIAVLHCFTELKKLQELHLTCYFHDEQEKNLGHAHNKIQNVIIDVAKELPHLQIFIFGGYIVEDSTMLIFIRSVERLKQMHVDSFGGAVTEQFIWDVVNARKAKRSSTTKGEPPLYLSFSDKGVDSYNMSEQVKELLQNEQVKQYVKVW